MRSNKSLTRSRMETKKEKKVRIRKVLKMVKLKKIAALAKVQRMKRDVMERMSNCQAIWNPQALLQMLQST